MALRARFLQRVVIIWAEGGWRVDTFLGRALTDAATGLPNVPYFRIIQNWEERRARRRNTQVRVIRVAVSGGGDGSRRTLLWRLCQELRTSDLIASEGRDVFHILLTTPDAENADAIAGRVRHLGAVLSDAEPGQSAPLLLRTEIEPPARQVAEKGPCDPCDEHELIKRPPAGPGAEGEPSSGSSG
jgi:GGDEF domain-containing protein